MGTLIDEINMLALSASLNTCCEIRLCTISRLFLSHTGDFVGYTTSRNPPSLRIVWLDGADSRSTAEATNPPRCNRSFPLTDIWPSLNRI
jgi:hypothetical protein